MKLSPIEFAALFDGLDWTRVQTAREFSNLSCRVGFVAYGFAPRRHEKLPEGIDTLPALVLTMMSERDVDTRRA